MNRDNVSFEESPIPKRGHLKGVHKSSSFHPLSEERRRRNGDGLLEVDAYWDRYDKWIGERGQRCTDMRKCADGSLKVCHVRRVWRDGGQGMRGDEKDEGRTVIQDDDETETKEWKREDN